VGKLEGYCASHAALSRQSRSITPSHYALVSKHNKRVPKTPARKDEPDPEKFAPKQKKAREDIELVHSDRRSRQSFHFCECSCRFPVALLSLAHRKMCRTPQMPGL
jgi:hypothetical protein